MTKQDIISIKENYFKALTYKRWEYGKSIPPKYTVDMMFRILQLKGKIDEQGNKIQTLSE